jgi:predicted alpha/beta-hydrolase family hydrolase
VLFVQGSRDAFGTPAELQPVIDALAPFATMHIVAGGDHSFKLARGSPAAQAAVYADVQRAIGGWIAKLTPQAR